LKWFPERRGLASGIIAAGFGSGTALFVPVIAYLIRQYDYRTAFLWTGIFQGLVIVIAAQFLRHPGPDFRPAKKDAVRKTVKQAQEFTSVEMLRTPQFYLLYAMFVLMAIGGLLVTAHAGPIALSWNLTVTALTVATALNPIANGASRIFWGWISDRLGRETTMGIAFALQAACLLAILTLGRLSGTWFTITLVLTFFTWGEIYTLFPSILGDWFGSRNGASNYSFLYTAKGVAAILGGGLAVRMAEGFGSWSAPFYASAMLALTAALMALVLRKTRLPRKVLTAPSQSVPVLTQS
jgi:OFA family oxalate/formate antiporter-like MFS transporter